METGKNKFNALTPEILAENKPIYTEALDYAFSNSDIKNIAITGIYGAGKSSVWRTYVATRNIKNCITISLGKYDDIVIDDENKQTNLGLENRLERQLINQMLSQMKTSDIPLSKYKFKENTTDKELNLKVFWTVLFIMSIVIWFIREPIISALNKLSNPFDTRIIIYLINAVIFIIPLVIFLLKFYKKNIVSFSKINLKGTEANFKEDKTDETVLDRDIKEIVYILNSSKSDVIVFEDLDRYDNSNIFTKLRELNFLLNSFIKSNDEERIVRFVYMIKDSLFFSKNRTKFFDFILPIVPIVDSKTSEYQLSELLSDVENKPDDNVIANISLYIDDMRLLKNVVNEYIVYSRIIPLKKMELKANNLFALITLKNVFPNEFDLLQADKGFIRLVFDRLEIERASLIKNFQIEIERKKEIIDYIKDKVVNDKFELMATMIPSDVSLYYSNKEPWAEYLRTWSNKSNENVLIRYDGGSSNWYNYNQFVDRYVLNTKERKSILEKYPENKDKELRKLSSEIVKIKHKLRGVEIYKYRDIISELQPESIDKLFLANDFDITHSHYFTLIRYLIVEGLIDETYWYYKGNFEIDKSKTLKRNDMLYMKNLLEAQKQDVFLNVETPKVVIKRLSSSDFNRFNILNKNILKTCIQENFEKYVIAITNSVDVNDEYDNLAKIVDHFDLGLTEKYISILLKNNEQNIINLLSVCNAENENAFRNILISLLTNDSIGTERLTLFTNYIEENEDIIIAIPEVKFDIFIDNISLSKIKFSHLKRTSKNVERLKAIEKTQSYVLNVENIICIAENLLGKKIYYGKLLSEIYQSELLISTKEYIDSNFIDFIQNYVNANTVNENYTSSEEIVIKILTSDLSDNYKINYINKNETIIDNIALIKNIIQNNEIIDILFNKDKIRFTKENILNYWNLINNYNENFVEYVDRNINQNNAYDILSSNKGLCNIFINDNEVSDKLFNFVIKYADEPIEIISSDLSEKRITILIKHNLIKRTSENIQLLLNKSYFKEIVLLVNLSNEDEEIEIITDLLSMELADEIVYMLINSNISDENVIKLLNKIKESVLIEKINSDKDVAITEILNNRLSYDNIHYICTVFPLFKFKDEFISNLLEFNMLNDLNTEDLSDSFIEYILISPKVSIDSKIDLIIKRINDGIEIEQLKKYLLSVKELSELVTIWNGKYPSIDNLHKERIADILREKKIAKIRKDGRLMLF